MPSRDELPSYLEQIARDADLLAAPPITVTAQPESWEDVATNDVDRGLERWAWASRLGDVKRRRPRRSGFSMK